MNAWERLQAADQLVDLVATAIRMRHPKSAEMHVITVDRLLRLPDASILEATARLQAWIDAWSMGDLDSRRASVDSRVQAAVALTGGPAAKAGG